MAEDGTRRSVPASLFEIDEFDVHDEAGRDAEHLGSPERDAELSSSVKASAPPPPLPHSEPLELAPLPPLELDLELDLGFDDVRSDDVRSEDAPSGAFAVERDRPSELELPLVHASLPTQPPPRRAPADAPTRRPGAFRASPAPAPEREPLRLEPESPVEEPEPTTRRAPPGLEWKLDEPLEPAACHPTVPPPHALGTDRREMPTVRPGLRRSLASSLDFSDFAPSHDAAEEDPNESDRPTFPGDPLLEAVRDRYATGDYSGALMMAEGILQNDSENSLARRYAENCRVVLEQMAVSRLGSLDQVPRVSVESDRLRWLSLDHRAGFMLSLIDGRSSVEELLDISGMPRFQALKILCELLDQDVILLSHSER